MTRYEISKRNGEVVTSVEADWIRWNPQDDRTKLYRRRRLFRDKCVHTTQPGEYANAVANQG